GLRAAGARSHGFYVRRRAESPRPRPVLGYDRTPRHQHSLYGADGDPRVHKMGRTISAKARSIIASRSGHGRRTDQSGSLGMVQHRDREGKMSNRRYVVADRNRYDHGFADTGCRADGSGFGDAAAAGNRN